MSRCNPCLPSRKKKNLVRGDFNKKSKRGKFSDRSTYTGAQPGQKRRQGGGRSISNIPGFFCLTQIPLVLNYIILSANHYHRKPIWANLYGDIVTHLDWGLQEGRRLAFVHYFTPGHETESGVSVGTQIFLKWLYVSWKTWITFERN